MQTEPHLPCEGKIYKQMSKIMAEVSPIAKARKNVAQSYMFRGVDDVYLALQELMAKHGVFSLPEVMAERTEDRTTQKGAALIYRVLTIKYTFFAEDGSNVSAVVVGEGMDSGDKASNKAMSVADKYALLQAFKIPTDDPKDPENDSHDVAKKKPPQEPMVKPQIYNNAYTQHQDLIIPTLKARKIDGALWEMVGKRLDGHPFTDLDKVIDLVLEELMR